MWIEKSEKRQLDSPFSLSLITLSASIKSLSSSSRLRCFTHFSVTLCSSPSTAGASPSETMLPTRPFVEEEGNGKASSWAAMVSGSETSTWDGD
jgi:hypothetical protein